MLDIDAALLDVQLMEALAVPAGALTRKLSCSQQKLYAQPTSHIPASTHRSRTSARPRRTSGVQRPRNVALSRSMYAVLIPVPVPVRASTAAIASALPRATRRVTSTTRRPL